MGKFDKTYYVEKVIITYKLQSFKIQLNGKTIIAYKLGEVKDFRILKLFKKQKETVHINL